MCNPASVRRSRDAEPSKSRACHALATRRRTRLPEFCSPVPPHGEATDTVLPRYDRANNSPGDA